MNELTRTQAAIMAAGALMMVVGTGCVIFGISVAPATILFAAGATAFAVMQMLQGYDGRNPTIKRLRKIMLFGDVCFIASALLMIENHFRLFFPYVATTMEGYNNWVHVVHNNWVVALLIAALMELYTTHRISYELKKEDAAE